jgi:hypothetical protein
MRWAPGAYASVGFNDYPDHPDQAEITRAVADALFAEVIPLALACDDEEYGAPAE